MTGTPEDLRASRERMKLSQARAAVASGTSPLTRAGAASRRSVNRLVEATAGVAVSALLTTLRTMTPMRRFAIIEWLEQGDAGPL
jgi:hypothetical protein